MLGDVPPAARAAPTSSRAVLRGAGRLLAAAVLPRSCPVCTADDPWCPGCRPLPGGLVVHRRGTGPVRAAMPYDAAGSAVVRAWKLGGRRDLTATLGGLVADAVAHASPRQGRGVVLVPVPVRPASRRRRGEDLVARLALHAARALPGACVVPALRWSRRVGEQVGLDPAQRARNMAASMVAEALPTGEVWVLDDVLTTGATLGEALRALQCRGARDLRPVALAAVVGFDAARAGRGLLPCPAPSGRDSLVPG